MTLALIVVTLASLAMAAALLMLVWRLLREERRRSDARVAALEAGILDVAAGVVEAAPAPRVSPTLSVISETRASQPAIEDPLSRPLDTRSVDAPEASTGHIHVDLFGSTARPARASRNFGLIAAVGVLIVGTGVALAMLSSRRDARPALIRTDHPAATTVAATSSAPLELVSLRHRRDGEALSITGVVRNPMAGARVQNVTAVVFLFDRNGGFLASGRAPIDFTMLVPGDESPFVVTVKEPGAVGRYRVSFRTDDKVIPHIDRREDVAVARSVS